MTSSVNPLPAAVVAKLRELVAPYCKELGYSFAYLEPIAHAAYLAGRESAFEEAAVIAEEFPAPYSRFTVEKIADAIRRARRAAKGTP